MAPFDYAVWFEDSERPVGDPEKEWIACLIVVAPDAGAAQAWGDALAKRRAPQRGDRFLWSSVEPHVCADAVEPSTHHPCANYSGTLPVVLEGKDATAEHIGW